MASVPLIVGTVDRDRRDAVIPASGRVGGKPEASQVIYIVADAAVHSSEFRVVEDPYLCPVKQTDRGNPVVESWRHRRPVLTPPEAKILAAEVEILVETCPGLRRFWPPPLMLGKSRQSQDGQK